MTSIVASILGQKLNESGDVVPVIATVPAYRRIKSKERPDKDEEKQDEKKMHDRVIKGILGIKEDSELDNTADKPVIPQDAQQVGSGLAAGQALNLPPVQEPKEKPVNPYAQSDMQLTPPKAALVVPDVTPDALKPLDQTMVPGDKKLVPDKPAGEPALDILLGRTEPNTNAPQSTVKPSVEQFKASIAARTSAILETARTGEIPAMATPAPHINPRSAQMIMTAFRKFA